MGKVFNRRFNQDPVEHFFGFVRLRCDSVCAFDNLTAANLKYILRKLIVMKTGSMAPVSGSNCYDFLEQHEVSGNGTGKMKSTIRV